MKTMLRPSKHELYFKLKVVEQNRSNTTTESGKEVRITFYFSAISKFRNVDLKSWLYKILGPLK